MKKIKGKENAYSVYSKTGQSVGEKMFADIGGALDFRKQMVVHNQMPRETWEEAMDRYIIVKCVITYKEV